jgi:hypothetical protein
MRPEGGEKDALENNGKHKATKGWKERPAYGRQSRSLRGQEVARPVLARAQGTFP